MNYLITYEAVQQHFIFSNDVYTFTEIFFAKNQDELKKHIDKEIKAAQKDANFMMIVGLKDVKKL